jgi:hypothetical protein
MQTVQPRFQIGDKICLDPNCPNKIGKLVYDKFQTEHYATVSHIFRNHFEYTGSPYLINFYFDSEPTRIHQCYLETRFILYVPHKKIENADLLGLILKGATP